MLSCVPQTNKTQPGGLWWPRLIYKELARVRVPTVALMNQAKKIKSLAKASLKEKNGEIVLRALENSAKCSCGTSYEKAEEMRLLNELCRSLKIKIWKRKRTVFDRINRRYSNTYGSPKEISCEMGNALNDLHILSDYRYKLKSLRKAMCLTCRIHFNVTRKKKYYKEECCASESEIVSPYDYLKGDIFGKF